MRFNSNRILSKFSKFVQGIKKLWFSYYNSINLEGSMLQCGPAYVIPVVFLFSFTNIGINLYENYYYFICWFPLIFSSIAGLISSTGYHYYWKHKNKHVAVISQLIDIPLYASSVTIMASLSSVPTVSCSLMVLYIIMCNQWARFIGISIISVIKIILIPFIFSLILDITVIQFFLFVFNFVFYLHQARLTRSYRTLEVKQEKTEDALDQVDILLKEDKVDSSVIAVGTLLHEIKNLILPVNFNLQFIKESSEINSIDASDALNDTIIDVDKISKIAEDYLCNIKDGDDKFCIKDLIDELYSNDINKNIIIKQLPNVYIKGKMENLRISIDNLINNAFEAGSSKVEIILMVVNGGGSITIAIEDDGPGIKEEIKNKLFTKFNTDEEKQGSSGLGLFLAKNKIKALGGKLELYKTDDKGTTFYITLPILKTAGNE